MKILLALMIAALLGGCASMHPTDPYAPVERGGRSVSVQGSEVQPVIKVPEGPLTLQRAIEAALANNPEVIARGWDTAAAQARRDQVFGARLPRLGIAAGYTRFLDEQRLIAASGEGEPGLFSRNIVSGDLVLSMPLFTGGRLVNQVKAADLLRQVASQRLARGREELVFNVSSTFYSILAQRHVVNSLGFSRKTLAEHLKRIDALVAAQKAARVDRMRTDVRLADIEQQLVREKNLLVIQRRVLASLMGLENGSGEIDPQGNLEPWEKGLIPDLETALATARQKRGDYLAARSSLEAQAGNVDVAMAGRWPTVSVQGAYGGRWGAGSSTGAGDDHGDVGRAGLVLEVPIFEGGQVDAGIREERANLAAGQQRLRLLDLQVRLEVETALLNVSSSGDRAAAIEKSIAQARESLRIEQWKYNLGKGAIVDVLDAQAALLESETTYYRLLAEFHTALAQLKLATGGE